jgi:DNA polymerase-3 subunit alpha
LHKYSQEIAVESLVVVTCDLYKDGGGVKLIAKTFVNLEHAFDSVDHIIELKIDTKQNLKEIINIIHIENAESKMQ